MQISRLCRAFGNFRRAYGNCAEALTSQPYFQFLLIVPISVGATFLLYEIFRRIGIFRFLFAIK